MGLPNKKPQIETMQSNELNNGTPNYAGISDLFSSNKGGYGFQPPSLASIGSNLMNGSDLMNTRYAKGVKMGMKTYKQMETPELAGTENIIDPQTMALYRMGRGY